MPETTDPKSNAELVGASLTNIVVALSPFLGAYGALAALSATALAQLAPQLSAALVALAAKGAPVTPDEEAALDAKIARLKNPDAYYH